MDSIKRKGIEAQSIKQFILWIIGYSPLLLLFILNEISLPISYGNWVKGIIFVICIFIIYRFAATIYIKLEIRKKKFTKQATIKESTSIPINEYSYFIITIFMPLIFEEITNVFDMISLATLLLLIIFIFTKSNYIIVNPIFLLSKYRVNKIVFESDSTKMSGFGLFEKDADIDKTMVYRRLFPNIYLFKSKINDDYDQSEK